MDVIVTEWNETKRTVTVQPHGVKQAPTLVHPLDSNPKSKLTPEKRLVGSIIVEQWSRTHKGEGASISRQGKIRTLLQTRQ